MYYKKLNKIKLNDNGVLFFWGISSELLNFTWLTGKYDVNFWTKAGLSLVNFWNTAIVIG